MPRLNDERMVDVLEAVDELSLAQSYQVLIRLKECPPEGVDALREAIASFDALDEMEVYKFMKEVKTRFDEEDWEALTDE